LLSTLKSNWDTLDQLVKLPLAFLLAGIKRDCATTRRRDPLDAAGQFSFGKLST